MKDVHGYMDIFLLIFGKQAAGPVRNAGNMGNRIYAQVRYDFVGLRWYIT